ncbi:MAG: dihydrofolate reductase family protein [Gaiellaceae bacterium MAG52_C11]|nr:dihydrofolate reductase family protein [Candidatus Gaiellasilicea maunaloa]
MRNVVLYHLQSLDGVGEEPGDWMSDGGEEIIDNLGAIIARQDAVVLGRGTYDYWAGYWPTADVELADLKQQDGGDIGIHGSIELSRTLLRADLVDELRLVVAPALARRGRKLFDGEDDGGLRLLELRDSRRTAAGSLLLSYRFAAT